MQPRPPRRLVVRAVIRRPDGAVLLIRRCDGGPWHEHWELPGGRAQAGESPRAALERESLEETGLDVHAAEHLHSRSWVTPRGMHIRELTFRCHIKGSCEVTISDEHDGFFWVTDTERPAGDIVDSAEPYLPLIEAA